MLRGGVLMPEISGYQIRANLSVSGPTIAAEVGYNLKVQHF